MSQCQRQLEQVNSFLFQTSSVILQEAKKLYEDFVEELKKYNIPVETGIFQADMRVEIINDGPVTMIIETPKSAEKTQSTENHLGLSEKEMRDIRQAFCREL